MPMAYGEAFIPQVMEGLLVRFGRYIPRPDIEAQLAPNTYMYTPPMTYTFDNYTNLGLQATLAVTKNCFAADDEPTVHAQSPPRQIGDRR
jgi:hypothetical protein